MSDLLQIEILKRGERIAIDYFSGVLILYFHSKAQETHLLLFSDKTPPEVIYNQTRKYFNEQIKESFFESKNIPVRIIAPSIFKYNSLFEDFSKDTEGCRYYQQKSNVSIRIEGASGQLKASGLVPLPVAKPVQVSPQVFLTKKVMIIDDSKSIRMILKKIIDDLKGYEVCCEVEDPRTVMEFIETYKPDLLTLDIKMPYINGPQVLDMVFKKMFLPVVVISSLAKDESTDIIDCLEKGAVDYLQKPELSEIERFKEELTEKFDVMRKIDRRSIRESKTSSLSQVSSLLPFARKQFLIAIGASTGGTEAIVKMLSCFPDEIPPTLIVQHIPKFFSKAFADRLNRLFPFDVREAEDGDLILPNRILVAPGGMQMEVVKKSGKYVVNITNKPKMSGHQPSVDMMFYSIAKLPITSKVVGIILTGMGSDGADGLAELRKKGSFTVGQDEASCVVYGMPKKAKMVGAVAIERPLDRIAAEVFQYISEKSQSLLDKIG